MQCSRLHSLLFALFIVPFLLAILLVPSFWYCFKSSVPCRVTDQNYNMTHDLSLKILQSDRQAVPPEEFQSKNGQFLGLTFQANTLNIYRAVI